MTTAEEDAPPEGCYHYGERDEAPDEINKSVFDLHLESLS